MNKEQLQFFYDEIMGMFGWDDGDEASGVDPLLWAKKEYAALRAELDAANKAVDEARELITKVSEKTGRYSRDPLTHASNIIEDNADAASAWLTAHPEKEQE